MKDLKPYKNSKTLKYKPMTKGEYASFRKEPQPSDPDTEGYIIVYGVACSAYSWSEKSVIDNSFEKI